jgi:hypothetical protein
MNMENFMKKLYKVRFNLHDTPEEDVRLPAQLRLLVLDWERNYGFLGGKHNACSRQVAAALFEIWFLQHKVQQSYVSRNEVNIDNRLKDQYITKK